MKRLGALALIFGSLWSLNATTSNLSRPSQDVNREAIPAHFAEARVTAGPTGVVIQWRTSLEIDNLGFNIYREQNGARVQVNPSIIAGSAAFRGQGTLPYQWLDREGTTDSVYYVEQVDLKGDSRVDGPYVPVWDAATSVKNRARLLTEATGESGTSQTEGPAGTAEGVVITPGAIQDQWLIASQPGLKIGIKQTGWYRITQPELAAAGLDSSGDSRNLRLFVEAREVPIKVSRESGALGASDFIEFYGTGVDTATTDTHVYYLLNGSQAGLRIKVFGELHTDAILSPPPLAVGSPVDSSLLQVNTSKPILWFGELSNGTRNANQSDPATSVEVDSTGVKSEQATLSDPVISKAPSIAPTVSSTAEAASGSPSPLASVPSAGPSKRSPAKRKSRRPYHPNRRHAAGLSRKMNHATAETGSAPGFLYEVQQKDRFVYFTSLLNGAAENFFGGSLASAPSAPTIRTLNITNLQATSTGTALLRVGLQGTTLQTHLVNVLLNDSPLGSMSFESQDYGEKTFNVNISLLREGANEVKFVIAGGSGDHELFSYARLTYPRLYRADNDALSFALRSNQSATVDGFTKSNIRVLDVSDPIAVQEIRPIVVNSGAGYALTIPANGVKAKGARTLFASPSDSFVHPASIALNQPSTLNQSANAADFVIVSHSSFLSLPSLATLIAQRQSQGYTVKLIDVEDVFDEFSYGAHTPQAITDFLLRARSVWPKAPGYLLLLGDASYDYRNYTGAGNFDLVPTKLIDTGFPGTSTALETGSDDSLADFDGDGIPEIAVGRLPVRTVTEANLELSKLVNFSVANVPQTAVMVADAQGTYYFNFEQANENLIALLPTGMQGSVQRIYRRLESSDAVAHTDIVNRFNQGAALVNYSGHGNVDVWTGAPIFSTSDALALTNGNKLPLVIVMDCLNGYFIAPSLDSVGEAFLKAPNGGAVATFTSSGLTIPDGQHEMGQRLFQLLYSGSSMALGDATRQAKSATSDIDVRRTWILLGDPTMKIR